MSYVPTAHVSANPIMINRILIANRGEIACRIMRTAKRMGIDCIAVFSDADKSAQHVKLADEAYYIGPSPANESYLNSQTIIEIAKKCHADAIHPGYGFLSENAEFAKLCEENNFIFIGPCASSIQAMGSKDQAKTIMDKAGVPLVPGYHGKEQSPNLLKQNADKIGYPVLIKANAGGGGKGMRIVENSADFLDMLSSCKREALASFGDDSVLLEKYLTQPRHVEIQVFCDKHGNDLYLFERDCSVQRRHQKIIEEAPAPGLSQETREKMGQIAIKAAKAIDYHGAGTVEFLLDSDGSFYFMEMNTRLQVEHPVTEKITGIDLVEWQIIVANNQALPLTQSELSINGHAFEVRIYAEDPLNDFLPSTGKITHIKFPKESQHIRVDSGIVSNDEVSIYYDPMIAKLIVWDKSRGSALSRLRGALTNFHIAGLTNNINFLHQLASHDAFINADIDTNFLNKYGDELTLSPEQPEDELIVAVALLIMLKQSQANTIDPNDPYSPWQKTSGWRLNEDNFHLIEFSQQAINHKIVAHFSEHVKPNGFLFEVNNKEYLTHGSIENNQLKMSFNGRLISIDFVQIDNQLILFKSAHSWLFEIKDQSQPIVHTTLNTNLTSPMPGAIIDILVDDGDYVEKGQPLIIIEAMKMEHTIKAHKNLIVQQVLYNIGDLVDDTVELISFEEQQD